jgi:hypothetical protein
MCVSSKKGAEYCIMSCVLKYCFVFCDKSIVVTSEPHYTGNGDSGPSETLSDTSGSSRVALTTALRTAFFISVISNAGTYYSVYITLIKCLMLCKLY